MELEITTLTDLLRSEYYADTVDPDSLRGRKTAFRKASKAMRKDIVRVLDATDDLIEMAYDRSFGLDETRRRVALAGLLYLEDEADAFPDFVPGVGYVDDLLVLARVIDFFRDDLKRYQRSKKSTKGRR